MFAIFPEVELVRLGFEHGIDLVDPDGILEFGDRTQVGYAVLHLGRRVPRSAIQALL